MIRATPFIGAMLLDEIAAQHEADGPLATAFGTRLRHSDAAACARRLSFVAAGVEPTEPFDLPSIWVTHLGSRIHEWLQAAVRRQFPDAGIETKLRVGDIDASGHADIIIDTTLGGAPHRILDETKTINGTGFKEAMGVGKYGGNGPKWPHIVQMSVNAKSCDADEARLTYLSMEAISKQMADRKGLNEIDRICGEWSWSRSEYEAIADAELRRWQWVLDTVDGGHLADRMYPEAQGVERRLDPERKDRNWWLCGHYCSHRSACLVAGPGTPAIPVTVRRAS